MQYSLNVIFISLLVRLQFFAAVGMFHFAVKSISIDSLVSGLIRDLHKTDCLRQLLNEQSLAHS